MSASPSGHRISVVVDGTEAWFESPDLPLRPSAEAVAAAWLIPAAVQGRKLAVDAPVAPDAWVNLHSAQDVVCRWWKYDGVLPQLHTRPVEVDPHFVPRTGLFFSGGVDSFYSLLGSGRHVDALILVQGFDIPLEDTGRAEAAERSCRAVADAWGCDMIVVRTNLRSHPSFADADWTRTHGGALASIGHLLGNRFSTFLISASNPATHRAPWGTHLELDRLWSGAGVTFEHIGAEADRLEKIEAIADNVLAQRHLRVCWENRTPSLNCSRCEKCLRTRIALVAAGALSRFAVFEPAETLIGRVEALPAITDPVLFSHYESILERELPAHLAAAVTRLVTRSRRRLWRLRWEQTKRRSRSVWRRLAPRHAAGSSGDVPSSMR